MGISAEIIQYVRCDFLGPPFRAVYSGWPQGGVLSPLLYNLYVADICKSVPRTVSQFADDIAIFL